MRLDLQLAEALAPYGYNGFGVIARARFDAAAPPPFRCDVIHPPARSVLVVATAGPWHFRAFVEWIAVDPIARLARQPHPLDAFTADVFARLELPGARVVFPTFNAPLVLDFVKMAELAGLGRPSEIGLLVDPRFGPWLSLRAAIFTPEELPDDVATSLGARACDGCPAPCRAPTDPLSRRLACIVAPELAYDELQRLYHYDRPRGRRLLCERFGVKDEAIPEARS
ncbi:MAG: Ferredoxin [bacterium]|nr:Ferredoxin [bacterium]